MCFQSDRSSTITRVPHSTLPMPLVSMALAPLLPSSSRTLDNDPCHGPGLCILCTILPHVPLAVVPYPASKFAFPGIDFVVTCGFVELPTEGLVLGSHATSSPFPMLCPGWKVSIVTVPSSSVVSKMPQTMHDVVQPLASYLLGVEPDYLLYSKVSPHWTPVQNGAATSPVKYSLQGGSRGGSYDL